ncbi:hypothetical protein [Streptomyces sp. WELS2]|uniref:hypothetical protein n=1 Tax=Streptomyces sp. WELS2 TaxID=2749435 RepID=UPI0015F00CD5|nr:hypothetical protein [Streptomyces sp. WELS2]
MASDTFPVSRSERLERLRAQLQGRPAGARRAQRAEPSRNARLLLGVMLRGAARLDAGMELTDLERRLVDGVCRLLDEEEVREFGRVFLAETTAQGAPQLFPDTLTGRGLAEGYSQADLLKDLPTLAADVLAQPNVSIVDVAGREEGASLDTPEFAQGMADYGIGVTVVHSSQPADAGTVAAETPFTIRLDLHKFVCVRDTPEATRDEIYWVYGASNAEGAAKRQVTREYGSVNKGSVRYFDSGTTLFDGRTTKGIPAYVACWEADDSPSSWYNALSRTLDDIIHQLNEFARIIEQYPAGQYPEFNAVDLAYYAVAIATFIQVLIDFFRNDDDLVQERVLAFSRNAIKSLANRPGETDRWRFDSKEGTFDLYVKASVPNGTRLRHATTTDGSTWTASTLLPTADSLAGPALTVYKNRLYCVHRGGNGNDQLYYCEYDGTRWGQDSRIQPYKSVYQPALAVFNNKLYCVVRGADDEHLYEMTFNGTTWSGGNRMQSYRSAFGPALAAFNNKLYCVYRGADDEHLWLRTFDGNSWSDHSQLGSHRASAGPALAVYNNKLYCVYRGMGEELRWFTIPSAGASTMMGTQHSAAAPALTVHNGRLYSVHRASVSASDPRLYWTTFDGNRWHTDTGFNTTATSVEAPAIASYNGKLHVVHRGGGIL